MANTDKVPFYRLTKKEKKHLQRSGISTLNQFKSTRKAQNEDLVKSIIKENEYTPGIMEPCFECKMISRRLGLETQESQSQLIKNALNPPDVSPVKQFPPKIGNEGENSEKD